MLDINNELLLKFSDFIYENSGIKFDNKNKAVLQSRIISAIREFKLEDPLELYKLITTNIQKKNYFLDLITTNLTRFFRNEMHFKTFEKFIIPKLIEIKKKEKKNKIILWSAGCSTGEEPYSLAFVLKSKLPKNFDFIIIASDLSLKSLMIAKKGYYSKEKFNNVPKEYMIYMQPDINGYKVSNGIRNHIIFDYHNLKHKNGFTNIDTIFCRNVLIYFDEKSRIEVLKRFYASMSSHSYLFIGHSESLFGLNLPFKFLKTEWSIIYEKNNKEKQKKDQDKTKFQNKYNL